MTDEAAFSFFSFFDGCEVDFPLLSLPLTFSLPPNKILVSLESRLLVINKRMSADDGGAGAPLSQGLKRAASLPESINPHTLRVRGIGVIDAGLTALLFHPYKMRAIISSEQDFHAQILELSK